MKTSNFKNFSDYFFEWHRSEPVSRLQVSFSFYRNSLIGSHIIVLFGNELSFLEALIAPEYYQAMAGSFPIALCLTGYVNFVSGKLDNY